MKLFLTFGLLVKIPCLRAPRLRVERAGTTVREPTLASKQQCHLQIVAFGIALRQACKLCRPYTRNNMGPVMVHWGTPDVLNRACCETNLLVDTAAKTEEPIYG